MTGADLYAAGISARAAYQRLLEVFGAQDSRTTKGIAMSDFETTAQRLDDTDLAEVTGGMWANYDWMNYDWRDAVMMALP